MGHLSDIAAGHEGPGQKGVPAFCYDWGIVHEHHRVNLTATVAELLEEGFPNSA